MKRIVTLQSPSKDFDVNRLPYKYAIKEHEPILLSNGRYLHSYRVTPYSQESAYYGDSCEENQAFNDTINY